MKKFALALAVGWLFGACPSAPAQHEVLGKNGPVWEYNGVPSPSGRIGDPANRLAVTVRNGETVTFKNVSGRHGVIFENAQAEMSNGIWQLAGGPQMLTERPEHFPMGALGTPQVGLGNILTIKVTGLQPGQAILFACNPHSIPAGGPAEVVPMIGKIVLADQPVREHKDKAGHGGVDAFSKLPPSNSCRVLAFDKAEVHPGTASGTYILVVRGTAPCVNMQVRLVPVFYVTQPEYWDVEVVGCLPGGVCLPQIKEFTESLPLQGPMGKKGIRVVGANKTQTIDIPGSGGKGR